MRPIVLARVVVVPLLLLFPVASFGQTLAQFTFETSVPTTAGPHAAEGGVFMTASFASNNSGGATSNPVGNGSAESFSSNGWVAGEYFQFTTSSVGYQDLVVSYAQATSTTGPGTFQFSYSADGGLNFVDFGPAYTGPTGDFSIGVSNPMNVISHDLSAVSGLDNQASLFFRINVVGNVAENGGVLNSSGTFRVDDFTVAVAPVPEPATILGLAASALGIGRLARGCFARPRNNTPSGPAP